MCLSSGGRHQNDRNPRDPVSPPARRVDSLGKIEQTVAGSTSFTLQLIGTLPDHLYHLAVAPFPEMLGTQRKFEGRCIQSSLTDQPAGGERIEKLEINGVLRSVLPHRPDAGTGTTYAGHEGQEKTNAHAHHKYLNRLSPLIVANELCAASS